MKITKSVKGPWEVGACYEGWLIGLLSYYDKFSRLCALERHNLTEEAFILVKGEATLYIADKDLNISDYVMEIGTVYTVGQGEWHHIVVSKDALVIVVENSNTTTENSDYLTLA